MRELTANFIFDSGQQEHRSQLRCNLSRRQAGSTWLRNDDNILGGQNPFMASKKFPQQPFDPVPLYGLA